MHNLELFDIEYVRMTFIFGILLSVLFYEKTHSTTGSLVVPGYIAVEILNPVSLLATAINALITFYIVSKFIPKFATVYGRTRFGLYIGISVTLAILTEPISALASTQTPIKVIGYVIPALIAYDFNRQGITKTTRNIAIVSCLAAIPALFLFLAAQHPNTTTALTAETQLYGLGNQWIPLIALFSVGTSLTIFSQHGLKAGGFIGPMYLGPIAIQPPQIAFILTIAITTYLLHEHILKRFMITFGRRKFSTMLITGSLLSWTALEISPALTPQGYTTSDMAIAALFLPALLANDMERTSINQVLYASVLTGATVLATTLILSKTIESQPIPIVLPALLAITLPTIFWPTIKKQLPLDRVIGFQRAG